MHWKGPSSKFGHVNKNAKAPEGAFVFSGPTIQTIPTCIPLLAETGKNEEYAMKRWTVWLDYFATGEGRTFMALVTYAETAEDAR